MDYEAKDSLLTPTLLVQSGTRIARRAMGCVGSPLAEEIRLAIAPATGRAAIANVVVCVVL